MSIETEKLEGPVPLSGAEGETYVTPSAPASVMPDHAKQKQDNKKRRRNIVLIALAVLLVVGLALTIPKILYMWNHVSTDDAAFNSHVTYISAREIGNAREVLADDNQFVEQGMPLVRLDAEPYQVAADQRQAELASVKATAAQQIAALGVAQADLDQARTQVRAQLAGLKAAWYLVASVQDFVRYEKATLASNVANLNQQEASLRLAQQEYGRVKRLSSQAVSVEEIESRKAALDVAEAQVATAQATIQQTRAILGAANDTGNPATVPSDVAETFNGTQYAIAAFQQAMAGLGLNFDLNSSPELSGLKDKYESLALESVVDNAPTTKVAKARLDQAKAGLVVPGDGKINVEDQPAVMAAEKALAEARLQLGYTQINAPISGFVSGRNVNPGNNVAAGQALMVIRPLSDVWIDADFKETQLENLRVGQKVDIFVDAYPGKIFHGHVQGFSSGTGAVLSLLPPENATGNFVKVVQRLPVRISVDPQTPEEMREYPLFAGLSVEPDVDIKTAPEGPDAGERLLSAAPASSGEPSR